MIAKPSFALMLSGVELVNDACGYQRNSKLMCLLKHQIEVLLLQVNHDP
jgi:hypothetical protein